MSLSLHKAYEIVSEVLRTHCSDPDRYLELSSKCRQMKTQKNIDPRGLPIMDELMRKLEAIDDTVFIELADSFYKKEIAFLFQK